MNREIVKPEKSHPAGFFILHFSLFLFSVACFCGGFARPAWAQVQAGDVSMKLSGSAMAGYNGDYGNQMGSDHGLGVGGNADLNGSYFDPNFLSFDIQPFYNESRANSSYQSIFNSSGVSGGASIFGGSHFPGSISFSDTFNSQGTFALPGVANYTTRGNSENFAIGWGVAVPDFPRLHLSFSEGDNAYSIIGANGDGTSHIDSFSASVAYMLAGFNLNGIFTYSDVHMQVPQITVGEPAESSTSSNNSFTFGVGHRLPFNGGFSASAGRSEGSESSSDGYYSSSVDSASGAANFNPLRNLSVGANTQYTDNLLGSLYQSVIATGAVIPPTAYGEKSTSLTINSFANYAFPALHLTLGANVEHAEQNYLGAPVTANAYTGSATYGSRFFGGFLTAMLAATQTEASTESNQSILGWSGSLGYNRQVGAWNLGGSFSYNRDTQSLLIAYTTSGYTYQGVIGREISGRTYWSVHGGGSKGGLNDVSGSANSSLNYGTSLSTKLVSVSGNYSESSGNAILTPTGLVATPVPLPIVAPSAITLFGGHAYSASLGSTPLRRLTLGASWSKMISNTTNNGASTRASSDQMTAQLNYAFRQLQFVGGYSKLLQGFSLAGGSPTMVGSFFVGVNRNFNFF